MAGISLAGDREEETYVIISAHESTLAFYAEATGVDREDAIENALREKGDGSLLPVRPAKSHAEDTFIAVPKEEWVAYQFR